MRVKEIMTKDPACCEPETWVDQVARLMVEHDCGAIPVVELGTSRRPIGIVTDRDIVCRVVAKSDNPPAMKASQCMTTPCVTIGEDSSVDDCCQLMEEKMIRRVVVVNGNGECCGIVAQADLAIKEDERKVTEVVSQVSQPTREPSQVQH